MVIDLLSYNMSIFNPGLKVCIIVVFVIAAGILYQCRRKYGGLLRQISSLLLIVAITGTISALFRYQGDFFEHYKWGESIFGLVLAIIFLIIALFFRKKMNEIVTLFSSYEDEK